MEQMYCILDYETRSEADLKKVGAYEYARHPSTQILCVAWSIGTKKTLAEATVHVWSRFDKKNPYMPQEFATILQNPRIIKIAHNALFEQVITKYVLFGKIPVEHPVFDPDFWICTASMAAALALPRNLENACLALKLPVQKDMEGRKLILKMCKPRKATKKNKAKWHNKMSDLERIMLYCQRDVEAETELFLALPELNETERKVWLLDQKINLRGFAIDRPLVETTLKLIKEEVDNLNAETETLTEGALDTTNKRAKVLEWLLANGVWLPDLRAKTVADAISTGHVKGAAKRLLQIRQAVSKTSTAKYLAFEQRSRTDGRVRDILLYHGASTGRWGGTGVQPQNFPRGSIKDAHKAVDDIKTGDLEWVRALYGNPMEVFSSCLRSVIVASNDHQLYCGDYSSIEVRVLFWMAEHQRGLNAYRDEKDLYREMAAVIFNKKVEDVTKAEREVGKRAILGCGYGMGKDKFYETCKQYGQEVSEELAAKAVAAYRKTHHRVPAMWGNLERAAIAATTNRGKIFRINKTKWYVLGKILYCELPSGRRLAYYDPVIKYQETPWGDKRPVLYHWGTNPRTRKWELAGTYGGMLTENVVQATARDLMAAAMLKLDALHYEICLSVHDELLVERRKGEGRLDSFTTMMASYPVWAEGLPLKVDSWEGDRYKK